jgi:hypothetical protein
MKFRVLLVLATVLIAGPAFAQKIYIDYDEEYDGSKNKTFAWSETKETSLAATDPSLHSLIISEIEGHIIAGGIELVDDDPDLYVTYHGSTKEEMALDTSYYGYSAGRMGYGRYGGYGGYYGRYYGGGLGTSSSTTVRSYQVGTLVVDFWDAKTEKLVWRGIAANITISENPHKVKKKVEKALKKMVSKWQRMKKSKR